MHEIDEVLEYFSDFYASSIPKDKKNQVKWIIHQSNVRKVIWDIIIMLLLLFVSIVVPVRLAFDNDDPVEWIIIYALVDLVFFIDIIITFFTSYTDPITNMEVTDHKKIATNYVKGGWLIFDILSIIPLDYII